jgi:uncharacterized protein (TIGR02453 family)
MAKTKDAKHFTGFSKAGMRFLADLAKHNDRSWFQPRKQIYETELLEPLQALVADTSEALHKAKIPIGAVPTRSIFRIYRDIRFSRDKSPYKTNLGAYLAPTAGGPHEAPGGIYIHIQPKHSFIAIAFYELDKDQLHRWRTAMAKDPKKFVAMLKALKRNRLEISEGHEALKRMPRGFEEHAESPIARYFRLGSFTTGEDISDADVGSKRLITRVVSLAKKAKPLLAYGAAIG